MNADAPSNRHAPAPREYDGVICFGGCDWWYHNRAHYDLQMMRRFSERMPVLYVNSIGIRVPKLGEGAMFFKRVARKLKSLRRAFVRVGDRFGVCSPVVVPGKAGMAISRRLLAPQVTAAARRMGIRRPLVWVTCPPGAEAVDALRPAAVVYERTDRWEAFPDANAELIKRYDVFMKRRADVTLYCATLLFDEEASQCRHALYVDHGVDFPMFERGGLGATPEPPDVAALPRPRVGFIGGLDDHTFDPPLFNAVAKAMPDVQFFLVGSSSLPEGWCTLPNVHLLGKRPYEQVPAYMAAADALIMPWAQNDWIRACNPVKLKEYLAVGRPVVTTDFYELRRYEGYVHVARGADDFVAKLRAALARPDDPALLRARVREQTWDAKAALVISDLAAQGLTPATGPRPSATPAPASAG